MLNMKAKSLLSISCDQDQFSQCKPLFEQSQTFQSISKYQAQSQNKYGRGSIKSTLSRADNDIQHLSRSVDMRFRNEGYPNLKELFKQQEEDKVNGNDIDGDVRSSSVCDTDHSKIKRYLPLMVGKSVISILMPAPKTKYFQKRKDPQDVSSLSYEHNGSLNRQQIQQGSKTYNKGIELLQKFQSDRVSLSQQKNNITTFSENNRTLKENKNQIPSSIDFNQDQSRTNLIGESQTTLQISFDPIKVDKLKDFVPKSSSSMRKYIQKSMFSEQKMITSDTKSHNSDKKRNLSTQSAQKTTKQQIENQIDKNLFTYSNSNFNESVNLTDDSFSIKNSKKEFKKKEIYLTKQERQTSSINCLSEPTINFSRLENYQENDSNIQQSYPLPNSRILKIYSELQKSNQLFDQQSPILMNSDLTQNEESMKLSKLQQLQKEKREAETDLLIINSSLIQHMQHTQDLFNSSNTLGLKNRLDFLLNSLVIQMNKTLEKKKIFL